MADYGLIGKKLGHSFSAIIHNKMGYDYELFELEETQVESFVCSRKLKGFNVTIPYKQTVMPYLDVIDSSAQAVGAVNTVVNNNDVLTGYNTDVYGMDYALTSSKIEVKGKKVLVLGSGGTSLTAVALMKMKEAGQVVVVSRNGICNYDNLYEHFDSQIIINTTPVGMYPNNGESLVDIDKFERLEGVFDAIYNPLKTKLLLDAQRRNIPCSNGLAMLVAQAKKARDLFFCSTIDNDIIEKIINHLTLEKINIVLIGMPSCGKSSIGKRIAELTKRPFVDSDAEIEKLCGKKISEIFNSDGEQTFRDKESKVLKDITKQGGQVIATGGGAILREDNIDALRQNGYVIYIKRDIELLSGEGRPLSSSRDKIISLDKQRAPIYTKVKDYEINNNQDISIVADKLVEAISESFSN